MSLRESVEDVKPETRKAILVCEGRCIRPKVHFYVKSVVESKLTNGGEFGVAFYFGCKECGHLRQYGFEGIRLDFGGSDEL